MMDDVVENLQNKIENLSQSLVLIFEARSQTIQREEFHSWKTDEKSKESRVHPREVPNPSRK